MKTKRIISALLSICLLLSSVYLPGLSAFADGDTPATEGECGENAVWEYDESTHTLEIGGVGAMEDYSQGAAPWYAFKDEITTVNVGNGITSIGGYSFYQLSALTRVVLADSVTIVGHYSFKGCNSLQTISIPINVTYVGGYVFAECSSLSTIVFQNSKTRIDWGVFQNCTSLQSISLPSEIRAVEGGTFEGCTSLQSIVFPESVESIGYKAFENCTSLNHIAIHKNIVNVSFPIFTGCDSLNDINISDDNPNYCSYESVIYDKSMSELLEYNDYNNRTVFNVPDNITTINSYAFSNSKLIESVIMPDTVTSIGASAFEDAISLKEVTLCDSLKTIGRYVFRRCNSDITLKIMISSIENYCNNMVSFRIFEDSATLPSSSKGTCKLYYNGSLITDVTIPNSVTSIDDYKFEGCKDITSINIPNSVTSIGECAFAYCNGLTDITIPDSVNSIGDGAFYKCVMLSSVDLSDNLENLSYSLFNGCSSLNTVYLPQNLKSIGASSFEYCRQLSSITIPDSVNSIEDRAFYGSGLESVSLPNSVTSIGNEAFAFCYNLNTIGFSEKMSVISERAFYNCKSITTITIPSNITKIEKVAFGGCNNLKTVTILNKDCAIDFSTINSYTDRNFRTVKTVYGYAGSTAESFVNNYTSYNNPISFIVLCVDNTPNHVFELGEKYCTKGCGAINPDYVAQYNGTCGNGVKWNYNEDNLTLTIFGSGAMNDNEQPWSAFAINVKTVKVLNGVTHIGNNAFNGCTNVSKVEIADSVTTIGANAFDGCVWLRTVPVPASVTALGDDVFNGCKRLTLIEYSGTMSAWKEYSASVLATEEIKKAVVNCTDGAIYDDNLYIVEGNAIYTANRKKLIKIIKADEENEFTVADGVQVISEGTCENTDVEVVNCPDTVTDVEKDSLKSDSIRVVNFAENVESIDKEAMDSETMAVAYNESDTHKLLVANNHKSILTFEMDNAAASGDSETEMNIKPLTASAGLSVRRFNYKGSAIRPNVIIRENGVIISNNNYTDDNFYKNYSNNVYAGKASVHVVGRNKYKGAIGKFIYFHIYYYPSNLSVSLSATKFTYDGKAKTVKVKVKTPDGKVVPSNQYTISGASASAVGNHTVTITFKQDFDGKSVTYPMGYGKVTRNFTIVAPPQKKTSVVKKNNPLKAKGRTVKLMFKMLKLGNMTVAPSKAFKVSGAQGTVTYQKTKGNKKISVDSMGIVTVKKGLKKGTYKIKVRVTASGNNAYKPKSKTVKVKIRVK